METIQCAKCGKSGARLPKAPFRGDLGQRILDQICQDCWKDWLQHQTLLINHYGLDPRDPKAREFLYSQVESVLLDGEDADQVDTSQQGTIEW